ncbi:hypothetical protein KY092_14325 [Natronomonas gomsonensis]|uniref:hypothetical protein n=1 Tax=Natronomonas gomsonensis TaxID=1046043 RepID=UPI0020CA9997|nr:hypothetical protein [Natronomonas gomsonensis]MCY4731731.1 hypothetical protein [Natronomonas gomsonensis]
MRDDGFDPLVPFFLAELLTLVVAFAVVAASLLDRTALLASFSRTIRLLALGFLTVELLVPAWLYYDIRKRGGDRVWLHASVMPVVNLLAVAAYVSERNARED